MSNKIIKIDETDRKIIKELDKNSRQTDSEISRNIKTSKQVVNYRINHLLQKEIIKNFYAIINTGKLGFDSYYVFFQLENMNKEEQNRLIKKLIEKRYIGWAIEGVGRWELIILIFAKTIEEFKKNLNEILSIYKDRLSNYKFSLLLEAEHLGYKQIKQDKREEVKQTSKESTIKLKDIERKIIKVLSQDARISIVDISEKIKIPLHVVKYNLKNLIKSKIIEGFKPKINLNLLGYQWYLLLINFKENIEENNKKEFTNFCKNEKEVYYLTNTIGEYNLMIDLHIKEISELKEFILKIKEKFPKLIKNYELLNVFEEHKINYFPE